VPQKILTGSNCIDGNLDGGIAVETITLVYGEAEMGLSLAIISDFRLRHLEEGSVAPEGTYLERLAKVALHEMAHTFSLYHCETPKCLMQYSRRLSHLDELDIFFCERCRFALRQSIKNLQS